MSYTRFGQTDPVLFDGHETYGRWNNPITQAILDNLSLFIVDSRFAGRPDLIAEKLYGDTSLDWILVVVNNATDVMNWPRAGDTIRVPIPTILTSELL